MSLDVGQALRAGYDNLATTDGLTVLSVLLAFNLVFEAVVASFRPRLVERIRAGQFGLESPRLVIEPPLDLDSFVPELPLSVLAALVLVGLVGNELVRFWAIRLFASPTRGQLSNAADRVPVVLAVGGGFALFLFALRKLLPLLWVGEGFQTVMLASQTAGVVALVLVGVAVYLRQELALTDAGAAESVRASIARFVAAPVPVLGLLAVLGLLGLLTGLPTALAIYAVGATPGGGDTVVAVAELVGIVLGAVLSTFSIATVTDAYLQVRGDAFRERPDSAYRGL